jgi:hypothetical protein
VACSLQPQNRAHNFAPEASVHLHPNLRLVSSLAFASYLYAMLAPEELEAMTKRELCTVIQEEADSGVSSRTKPPTSIMYN